MCFSASASFGASAILAVAGIAALKKTETSSQIMFASIPIIFSILQFIEGFVWLTLTHSNFSQLQSIPTTIFLFVAQAVWPFWLPLSFLLIEKDKRRKMMLKALVGLGSLASLFLAYRVLFHPVSAAITPFHIDYQLSFSYQQYSIIVSIFYFLATIIPPFIAGGKRMISLGLLNLTSFIITIIFFENYVISVWCYFAALISLEVFLAIKDLNAKPRLTPISLDLIK